MRLHLTRHSARLRAAATLITLLSGAQAALAHPGHGQPGIGHGHADHALMLMALVAAGAAGLWLARRK